MKKCYLIALTFLATAIHLQAQVIFNETFETYDLGDMLNQNTELWGVWSGNNNAAEDIDITDAYSNSGTKCGFIGPGQGPQDVLLNLGNKTTGVYQLTFQMFIPTGKTAYFNVQGMLSATGGAGNGGVGIFNSTNLIFNNAENPAGGPGIGGAYPALTAGAANYVWDYPEAAWFPIVITFYPDSSQWQMSVNNVEIARQTMSEDMVVGGIDFFAFNANNEYYIDDVVFTEGDLTDIKSQEAIVLEVYPNPVVDELFIRTEEEVDELILYNILGQAVIRKQTNQISPSINLGELRSGTYLLKIVIGEKSKTIKISK